MACIYFIKSQLDNWIYVGSTSNIERRLKQHNSGEVTSTKSRRPYDLIYTEEYSTVEEARKREMEIKKVRKIKESILKNIPALSSNG